MEYFAIEYCASRHSEPEAIYFPDIDDHIVNTIRKRGTFYESDLLKHLWLTVPRQGVFIDVGANIGNHTVFFAKFMASRVLAIEPNPHTYDILNSVITKNGLTNVQTIKTAVGCEKGTALLSLPDGFEGNSGAYAISQDSPDEDSIKVTIDSLDAIISQHVEDHQKITMIKIDVEGYEQQVLKGAAHILENHRPHLTLEIQSVEQYKIIKKDLASMGYHVLGRYCVTPTYHFACWSTTRYVAWRLQRKIRHVISRIRGNRSES